MLLFEGLCLSRLGFEVCVDLCLVALVQFWLRPKVGEVLTGYL